MSLVTLASATGSPGTTTVALRLARELHRRMEGTSHAAMFLVDADADGGDIGLRLRLDPVPGVATLALAGRHGLDEELLGSHAQRARALDGVLVVPGISGRAQAPALERLAARLAEVASGPGPQVLVDAGRTGSTTVAPLIARAEHVVFVCRSDAASMVHTRSALAALGSNLRVSCAVIAGAKEAPEELSAALGRDVAAVLPLERQNRPLESGRHREQVPAPSRAMNEAVAQLAGVVTGDRAPLATPPLLAHESAPQHVLATALTAPARLMAR